MNGNFWFPYLSLSLFSRDYSLSFPASLNRDRTVNSDTLSPIQHLRQQHLQHLAGNSTLICSGTIREDDRCCSRAGQIEGKHGLDYSKTETRIGARNCRPRIVVAGRLKERAILKDLATLCSDCRLVLVAFLGEVGSSAPSC